MPTCETCGNDYDKTFTVTMGGRSHAFDSFECAIQALAPTCAHCHCRIIGHGVEDDGTFFCCANCAAREGVQSLRTAPSSVGAPCSARPSQPEDGRLVVFRELEVDG